MDLKSKVLSGLKWSAAAKFGSQLITWSVTIFVMRLLEPADYGLVAMAGVFVSLCLILNEMGMGAAIVQSKELKSELLGQVFGIVILMNGLLCLILILATTLIAQFYDEPRLVQIIPMLALQFPMWALIVIPRALLVREMKFKTISMVEIAATIFTSLTTLVLALQGYGVMSLVIGTLVNVLARSIGFNIVHPYLKLPSFNFTGFSERAKFGGLVSLNRFLWYIYSQADVFIVGKFLGKIVLGYYSVGMLLATMPMEKVASIMHQVAFPAFSQIQDNKEQAGAYLLKSARAIAFIAFPVFFGISAVARPLIELVLADDWLPAILPLQLLSLVVPLRMIQTALGTAVSALGRPDINVKNLSVACIVMPGAFLIGVQWDLVGVSMAWVIAYTGWFLFMLWRSLPIVNISVIVFLRNIAPPIIVSAFMYLAVSFVGWGLSSVNASSLLLLVAMVATGGLVFVSAILLFFRPMWREMIGLLRK